MNPTCKKCGVNIAAVASQVSMSNGARYHLTCYQSPNETKLIKDLSDSQINEGLQRARIDRLIGDKDFYEREMYKAQKERDAAQARVTEVEALRERDRVRAVVAAKAAPAPIVNLPPKGEAVAPAPGRFALIEME